MLLKFNCFNESLGINDSLVIAGKKIFDIINSDDKTYYLIPNIKIGKYIVEVEINIKEEKDNGSFSASDSSNKKISISLSSRDKYSTLVHELKHAHRFLYRKNSNINYREKDNILSQSINQFSNLYDDEFILINFIIYFMNIDEFEAQYHSMYIELSQNKKLSKDDIDSDVHVKSYRNMLEIIGKDNFMDIIFKKIDKTRFLLMLYRNELKQDKGDLIFRNLKLSDLTYTGKFIFNMKKFLLSKNIIKLSDKEKTELYRLEKEIKKILIKNSRIIQKKLSRLYLLVNENKTLNETCNVDVGISDEDMDDIICSYILDEFPELSYSIESTSGSGIVKYDNESFIIDLFTDDKKELYYLEPKIFKLIEQIDSQLKPYGLKVFFSDFGQNDAIYEIVITKINNKPKVWTDRYYTDDGNIEGYTQFIGNRTTSKSKYKFDV